MKQVQSVIEILNEIKQKKMAARKRSILVVLDGRSGTGKTMLSQQIGSALGAAVILGDDFFSGGTFEEWAKRPVKGKVEDCIDWKRMRSEVLEPLLAGKTAAWRTCNWETLAGLSADMITCKPSSVIILDGAYSSRSELQDIVDLSILVQLDDKTRRDRLKNREGTSFMAKWHSVWDEAEDYYFTTVRPPSSFDLVFDAENFEIITP